MERWQKLAEVKQRSSNRKMLNGIHGDLLFRGHGTHYVQVLALNVKCAPGDRRVTGLKTWELRYDLNGKSRINKIGRYPQLSLEDARDLAYKLKDEAGKGRDPRELVKHGFSVGGVTVKTMCKLMVEKKSYPLSRQSEGYKGNFFANFRKHVWPMYGERSVDSMEFLDWKDIIDKLIDDDLNGAANNMVAYIGCFYKNAKTHSAYTDLFNPMIGRRGNLGLPDLNVRRRILSYSELKQIWGDFGGGSNQQAIVRMLILTGQRIGNILTMRWNRIGDLENELGEVDKDVWLVGTPLDMKYKKGGDHLLPITPEMKAVIDSMRGADKTWVFPGYASSHLTHSAVLHALNRYTERTETRQFVLHDIRRSFTTHCEVAGLHHVGIKRVLHHQVDSSITESTYIHSSFLDLKRKVLEGWTDLLREKGVI